MAPSVSIEYASVRKSPRPSVRSFWFWSQHQLRRLHLLGRRREVAVPDEGRLLAERLLDGHHPPQPPGGQGGGLRPDLPVALLAGVGAGALRGRRDRREGRRRGAVRAGVGRRVARQHRRDVGRDTLLHHGVHVGAGRAEPACAAATARPPPTRWSCPDRSRPVFEEGQDRDPDPVSIAAPSARCAGGPGAPTAPVTSMTCHVASESSPFPAASTTGTRARRPGRRRRGRRALARRPVAARRRRGGPARRLLLRRLPALRGDRPLLAGHGLGDRRGARRPAGAGHLQRLPGALRGAPAARRADPQRAPALRLPRPGAARRERQHRLDERVPRGPGDRHPDQERRGRLRRRRRARSTSSRPTAGSSPATCTATPTAACATSPASPTRPATSSA